MFCVGLLLVLLPARLAAETNVADTVTAPPQSEMAFSNEVMRALLQLQGQLHQTRVTLEETRAQSEEAATTAAERLASQLKASEEATGRLMAEQLRKVEESFSAQRTRDTRFTVTIMSVFAGICFLAVAMTSFFQWKTVNRLAEMSNVMPMARGVGGVSSVPALGSGENALVPADTSSVEQSSQRLLGAIERLERRILDLEQVARPVLGERSAEGNGEGNGHASKEGPAAALISADEQDRIRRLVNEGQELLNRDDAEGAIRCFDQVLAIDPKHAETLVKKGTALEKLRKLSEAIECYDRAIAADSNMTIAYLHKGGLFNRMERFTEAVECYEQALRTQEKRPVS